MRKLVLRVLGATVLVVSLLTGSVGAHGQAGTHIAAGGGKARTIIIKAFAYTVPKFVRAGSKVTVINKDHETHSVTSRNGGLFFSVTVAGGATGHFTAPSTPSWYGFECIYHGGMTGVLVVKKHR